MKPRLFALACLILGASLACAPLSKLAAGSGGGAASVLPDPSAGLEALDNYQASLIVGFEGTLEGTPSETSDAYEQSVWHSPQAVFTSVEARDENGDPIDFIVGTVGEAYYLQEGDLPCFVQWGSPPSTTFSPAARLWPVGDAQLKAQETVNGILSSHYAFDSAAMGLGDEITVTGDLWLAEEGGYVVKYALTLEAGEEFFGEGSSGRTTIAYELSQVNSRPEVVYPNGCRAVYTGIPVLPEALDLNRQPSTTMYFAETDLTAAATFYKQEMDALGWELDTTHEADPERLGLLFSHPTEGLEALISMRIEDPGIRVIASVFGLPSAAPAEGAVQPAATGGVSAPERVMGSVMSLLGSDSEPSVLPSYHMESRHQAPVWTGSSIGQQQTTLIADVEGENVHFTDKVTSPSGGTSTEEAYLIGDQEYVVESGTLRPGIGMSRLTWVMWPLDVTTILGASISGATLTGTETLDGRIAEAYDVQGAGIGEAMGGMGAGLVLPVTAASGQVWVDQETGALLKAVLDYEVDLLDADGQSQGTGSGHLEIEVTQVGQVEVVLPAG